LAVTKVPARIIGEGTGMMKLHALMIRTGLLVVSVPVPVINLPRLTTPEFSALVNLGCKVSKPMGKEGFLQARSLWLPRLASAEYPELAIQ
jgi:hypothetical protein